MSSRKKVDYVVEATNEEQYGYWKEYIKDTGIHWSNGEGFMALVTKEHVPNVKAEHNLEISVGVTYREIGPNKVLVAFYEPLGRYCDWDIVEAWMKQEICSEHCKELVTTNGFYAGVLRPIMEKAGKNISLSKEHKVIVTDKV